MIKINLLPQKRAKRQAGPPSVGDSGAKHLLLGIGGLVGAAVLVLVALDMPLRNEKGDLDESTAKLANANKDKEKELVGYPEMKKAEADAITKIQAINRLKAARVVPANVLHELGQVLTNHGPTMTVRMAVQTDKDSNKKFQQDWDPTHVWMSGFTDTAGVFKLEGGAQSRDDVTQLSKRLAASVYFMDVVPSSGDRVTDVESNLSYYKFTITGKLAY
jgi:Tfp pilus assembly protein PilN